jgi:xanthine/uracil permease
MIAVLGARIWIENRVDFRDPVNLTTAAVALVVGAGDYTLHWGDYEFAGIALGTVAAIVVYQVLRAAGRHNRPSSADDAGTVPASPASVPATAGPP